MSNHSEKVVIPTGVFYEQKTHVCSFINGDSEEVDQINLIEMIPSIGSLSLGSHPNIYIICASIQESGPMPGTQFNFSHNVQLHCTNIDDAIKMAPDVYKEVIDILKTQAARARLMIHGGPGQI